MRVEVTIDKKKKLPDDVVPALGSELSRRIGQNYEGSKLTVCRANIDGLNVVGGEKIDKQRSEEILQETWESANE